MNITVVTQNWNNNGSNVYMPTITLLSTFVITKKLVLSISVGFHKNSKILACFTFGKFKTRTLTASRCKNQTNDTFKLLGHNFIHQQEFLKQKIVTFHCYSFNLKFLIRYYFHHYRR